MDVEVDPIWKHVRIEATSEDAFTRGIVRDKHELLADESTELPFGGQDEHPSAVDLLLTSLVACQVSVLQQCFEKARIEEYDIRAEATIDDDGREGIPEEMPSNTAKRVEHVAIELSVDVPDEYADRAERCLDVYDDGCIVGQSLRRGVDYTTNATLAVSGGSDSDR